MGCGLPPSAVIERLIDSPAMMLLRSRLAVTEAAAKTGMALHRIANIQGTILIGFKKELIITNP
jgi:hypothetical protein